MTGFKFKDDIFVSKSITLEVPIICTTSGNGHWSSHKKQTRVNKIELGFYKYCYKDSNSIYVNAIIPKSSWSVKRYGLIYTDPQWLRDFNSQVKILLPHVFTDYVDYTEQGMQGNDYVSMSMLLKGQRKMREFMLRNDMISRLTFSR